MLEYTTLETLKDYLGLNEDNSKDATLSRLIKTITKQFDKYLGFSLGETTYKQYLTAYDDCIIVDYAPVNEILTLKENSPSGSDLIKTRIDEQIIYIDNIASETVYIEYKAGYTTIDDLADVELACLEICALTFNKTPTSGVETGIKTRKVDILSKTYFSEEEINKGIQMNFREVLDNYKTNIYNPLRI